MGSIVITSPKNMCFRASAKTYTLIFSGLILAAFISSCTESFDDHQSNYPSAEVQGLNGKALEWLVDDIDAGTYGQIKSLVIMRNNQLVLEEYFNGASQSEQQTMYSVTKSVLSALFGIALSQGQIESLDEPMLNYFKEYDDIQNMNVWKEQITIRHLLGMSAGFEWNELDLPYSDNANIYNLWNQAEDKIQFVLDRPVIAQPGTKTNYNTGLSQLLSIILTKCTGQSASDFAAENLFNHLEIMEWSWSAMNESVSNGGFGLRLTAIDMAKFGQLFLDQGSLDSLQVIPTEWVNISTDSLSAMNIWTNYGYHWWSYSNRMVVSGLLNRSDIYYAAGFGGQILWIDPYYDMVMAVTSRNGDDYSRTEAILWDYLSNIVVDK